MAIAVGDRVPDVEVRTMGADGPHAVRTGICLTGQFATVDPSLTGTENLVLQGRLLGLTRRTARARAAELLDTFGPERDGVDEASFLAELRRRSDEIDQNKAGEVSWSTLKQEPL